MRIANQLLLAALFLFMAVGCDRSATAPESATNTASAPSGTMGGKISVSPDEARPLSGMQASPLDSTNLLRSFAARGVLREISPDLTSATVRHEEIPGFMPKMTMPFEVRNTNELKGLAVGDAIVFTIKADENDSWIEAIRRARPEDMVPAAPADPSSKALLHAAELKVGDVMPDAEIKGESGETLRLSDYAGKALAFTFIFSRCPLPDYCPRMNRNFSEARELLLQDVDAPQNWQFLSISFDPEFDKPGVLNRYAFSYRGALTNQWTFAAAPTNVLATFSRQLDFRFANEQGSFQHNLRTVVLDGQRRVVQYFEGNKWTAADLTNALTRAARVQ